MTRTSCQLMLIQCSFPYSLGFSGRARSTLNSITHDTNRMYCDDSEDTTLKSNQKSKFILACQFPAKMLESGARATTTGSVKGSGEQVRFKTQFESVNSVSGLYGQR